MTIKSRKRKNIRKRTGRRKSSNRKLKKYILPVILAVCLGIAAFFIINGYLDETESFDSNKYFVKGIDVSHHNPILNWENVMEQNISFAYLKATEGNTLLDRNYEFNYDLARKSNIRVGSYHFYTFALSGQEQAEHFLQSSKFNSGDLIPAIDVEHSPSNPYSKDKKFVELVINELKVMENIVYERFGIHPVIYTNKNCYKLYIKDYFPDNIIWMCDLQNEPSDDIKNWRIWQFSHKGELMGIDDHIDLNYYRYTFNEFKELLLP
ncbi:MAG: hypothetical protein LBN74_05515 [Prevotella sp.]|jgi:lysozyme|nr:hypothetical protein [Prevotella sp.]